MYDHVYAWASVRLLAQEWGKEDKYFIVYSGF